MQGLISVIDQVESTLQDNVSNTSETLTKFPGELHVKNVNKSFGVTKALDNVSFTGYFGEIHAIIGGNGCGKSTLAKVLAGVLPIDSGKVSINGHHPSTPKESRNLGVSMVFQEVLVAEDFARYKLIVWVYWRHLFCSWKYCLKFFFWHQSYHPINIIRIIRTYCFRNF